MVKSQYLKLWLFSKSDPVFSAFEAAQVGIVIRNTRGMIWPLFELFKDKFVAHKRVINDYLDPLIMDARAENLKREKAGLRALEDETLLGELVKTIKGMSHLPIADRWLLWIDIPGRARSRSK